jgi:hypothetical protein
LVDPGPGLSFNDLSITLYSVPILGGKLKHNLKYYLKLGIVLDIILVGLYDTGPGISSGFYSSLFLIIWVGPLTVAKCVYVPGPGAYGIGCCYSGLYSVPILKKNIRK